jgi:heavy metal sensor kinase
MLRSIQWTLQLWHAAILALAVVGIGLSDYYTIEQARYAEIDANLKAAGQVLVARLRPPPHRGPNGQDRPGEGPGDGHGIGPGEGPGDSAGDRNNPPPPRPEDFAEMGPAGFGPVDRIGDRLGDPFGGPPDARPPDRLPRNIDLPAGFMQQYATNDPSERSFVIFNDDDHRIIKSWGALYDPAFFPPKGQEPKGDAIVSRTRGDFHEVMFAAPAHSTVLVSGSVQRVENELHELLWRWAFAAVGVLAIGLTGGWLISRTAVAPIGLMSETAGSISATRWTRRIDAKKVPSELRQLAFVLNGTFDRLEAAFLQQARFTADASHELRTPLAVILSHTELALSRDRSPDEYRKTIDTCLSAASRMKSLVESLLLLSHADVGELALQPVPMDLADVVRDNVQMLVTLAGKKSITIATQLQNATFVGDPARISQVVANLVSNAIRYNRDGGSISVTTEVILGDAVLTVSDTGHGISPEDQLHVFDRFFRADKARSREAGGSGLGLAIVKSIIEAHGGIIEVESEPGVGSTFIARFPRGDFDTEAYAKPERLEV